MAGLTNHKKRERRRIAALFFFLLLAGLTGVAPADDKTLDLPEVVARINGTSITRAQFEARLAQSRSMNPERYDSMTAEDRNQAMLRTLNSIVLREIEVQEATKHGIKVSDKELERDLNDLKAHARTRGGLEKLLAEYRITLDQWKEEARRNLLIQKLEQTEAAKLPVTQSEIREEFTRHFWQEKHPPPEAVLAEHREHMLAVIRQRKWSLHRKEWLRPLVEAATVWRWTPGTPTVDTRTKVNARSLSK